MKYFSEAVIPSNVNLTQQLPYANASAAKINDFETIRQKPGVA